MKSPTRRRPWYRGYLPGWIVSGGGGSGAATVQTDGVTIQGDGSAGNKIAIKAVQTGASLTGAGTVASPLSEVPATYFQMGNAGSVLTATTNTTSYYGFVLPVPLTFSHIGARIQTADAGHNSDIGIYSSAGTLIAHVGAQAFAANGWVNTTIVGGAITIQPGNYLFAFTSAASTFALQGGFQGAPWAFSASADASAGGALPASITAPGIAPSDNILLRFALY